MLVISGGELVALEVSIIIVQVVQMIMKVAIVAQVKIPHFGLGRIVPVIKLQ